MVSVLSSLGHRFIKINSLFIVMSLVLVPRESRFTPEYLHQLKILLLLLLTGVKRDWSRVGLETTLSLCQSVAYFINDCWTIMDRGFLLEIVDISFLTMNCFSFKINFERFQISCSVCCFFVCCLLPSGAIVYETGER